MKFLLFLVISVPVFFAGCNRMQPETKRGTGSFDSNGERIYFTATSERGTSITSTGGPIQRMMMDRSLACVSCHGTDARGGKHTMHMKVMNAPDIRWSALSADHHDEEENTGQQEDHNDTYSFENFRNAVENGEHLDGDPLSKDMPRYNMSEADLRDLMNYLKSLK